MFSERDQYTGSPDDSKDLECLTCDLQQSSGHTNRYCYKCDQLFFSEASVCSTPMSKQSGPKTPKDDESPIISSREEAKAGISMAASISKSYPIQHGQRFGHAIQDPMSHGYGPSEQTRDSGFLPFAYNHGLTMPVVDRFEPTGGSSGTWVRVSLRSSRDLALNVAPNPSIIFGTQRSHSQIYPTGKHNGDFWYTLTFQVPPLAIPISPVLVPVYLSFNDATQNTTSPKHFGNFVYHNLVATHEMIGHALAPSMRRVSSDSATRRPVFQAPSWPALDSPVQPYYEQQDSSLRGPVQKSTNTTSPSNSMAYSAFSRPESNAQFIQYGSVSQGESMLWSSTASATQPPLGATSSDQTAGWYFAGQSLTPTSAQFGPIRTMTSTPSPIDNSGASRSQEMKRTISHSRLRTETSSQHFNPYSFPRATLEIQGDLNDMLKDWTREERSSSRRIVTFDKRQLGGVIQASFRAVSMADWDPDSICVSCIWWPEKREAFITSVDLIGLLESIVGLRFTLQEKNRIRRNLEGFKPYTIGKSKPDKEPISGDVESFFRIIMGLDEPKPRSIEKDVKVFPWKTLAAAMKKVVDKYSASYASTAGTLHPTASLPYSDDDESSRRPSASHSEAASSSARSTEREIGPETPFAPTVTSVTTSSGTIMPVAPASRSQDFLSSWQLSDSESGSYIPTATTMFPTQSYSQATEGPPMLQLSSTSDWNYTPHYYGVSDTFPKPSPRPNTTQS